MFVIFLHEIFVGLFLAISYRLGRSNSGNTVILQPKIESVGLNDSWIPGTAKSMTSGTLA